MSHSHNFRAAILPVICCMLASGLDAQEPVILMKNWPAPLYWQPSLSQAQKPMAAASEDRPAAAAAVAPTITPPLLFVGMAPCRIMDTRGNGFTGSFGPPGISANTWRTVPIQQSSCAIPATAQAYSLNVTVVPPGPLGYLTIWPTGETQPTVSTLNDLTGQILANAAVVAAGTGGSVNIYVNQTANVILDINGYYASATDLQGNTVLGVGALGGDTSGANNTAIGQNALLTNKTGMENTAIGVGALSNSTGGNNIALGYQAAENVTTTSNNIDIGNLGSAGDSGVIRIGTTFAQTTAYMAGIYNSTISGSPVVVNSNGQLGVGPAGVSAVNPQQVALLKWFPAYESQFSVGSGPSGVAFEGANIWVTNALDNSVTKLQASTGAILGAFNVGTYPSGVAFDGANIWVTNFNSNNVTKLRASDGTPLGTFGVGTRPVGVAFDGANIWVANSGSNNVTKLLASTGVVLGTFSTGGYPYAIAYDGANIWVANAVSNNVTKLQDSNGSVLGTFSVGTAPSGVAFDGASIWVANTGSNNVTRLQASTGALLGTFSTLNLSPYGVAFDGANIWVVNSGSNNVTEFQASTGSFLGSFSVGANPFSVAFDGANIWVANFSSNTLSKL